MFAPLNHIIVRVDTEQNDTAYIGGNLIQTGRRYNENFRERNPVVAEVVDGLGELKAGTFIICNYNYFEDESPHLLTDGLYSIPVNEEIFATITSDGDLLPIGGNIFVERVTKDSALPLPEELKKPHNNQGVITNNGEGYFKNQYVFWLTMADYEIYYFWNGVQRTAIKVHKSEIVGFLKK